MRVGCRRRTGPRRLAPACGRFRTSPCPPLPAFRALPSVSPLEALLPGCTGLLTAIARVTSTEEARQRLRKLEESRSLDNKTLAADFGRFVLHGPKSVWRQAGAPRLATRNSIRPSRACSGICVTSDITLCCGWQECARGFGEASHEHRL